MEIRNAPPGGEQLSYFEPHQYPAEVTINGLDFAITFKSFCERLQQSGKIMLGY
jgi:hypothetical protein